MGQGDNEYWVTESRRTSEQMRAMGGECSLRVVPGQAHVLTLLNALEEIFAGQGRLTQPGRAVRAAAETYTHSLGSARRGA